MLWNGKAISTSVDMSAAKRREREEAEAAEDPILREIRLAMAQEIMKQQWMDTWGRTLQTTIDGGHD